MPNFCCYEMKVRGKEEAVEEFIDIIQAKYQIKDGVCSHERHFWRVFEANVIDKHFENGVGYAEIDGDCAWSVYSCMCEGDNTYNNDCPNLGGTTLQKESERLNISIEVYSSENGCAFQEHYIYDCGECIVEDCVEWGEYCTDDFDSVEDLNAEYGTNFTQEEFENADDGYISVGGFGNWSFDGWLS